MSSGFGNFFDMGTGISLEGEKHKIEHNKVYVIFKYIKEVRQGYHSPLTGLRFLVRRMIQQPEMTVMIVPGKCQKNAGNRIFS